MAQIYYYRICNSFKYTFGNLKSNFLDQIGIYLFKANTRNTKIMYKICSKLKKDIRTKSLLLTLNRFHTLL